MKRCSLMIRETQKSPQRAIASHPLEGPISKEQKWSVGEGVAKLEPLDVAEHNVGVPQKIKNRVTMGSSTFTSISKEFKTGSWTDLCTSMFTTAQEGEAAHLSTDGEWMKNTWSTHNIKCYATLKHKKSYQAATWMSLEDIGAEWSKSGAKGQILYDSSHWNT